MKTTELITSPETFIVRPYSPGLTVDFREPAKTTDLENLRQRFDFAAFDRIDSPDEFAAAGGRMLVQLGIADDETDFASSLASYSDAKHLDAQLQTSLKKLNVHETPKSRSHALQLLLARTDCLTRNGHHAVRLHCHVPGATTDLEAGATHYGYVLDGNCSALEPRRTMALPENTYFSIAGEAAIKGDGRCVIVTHFDYQGITQYGGEVEDWGRLNYIDGCTDTLLVPPLRKGDPCYNTLYFPPSIEQTQHTHPSLRCGLIIGGEGICKTPTVAYPLVKGNIFFLPPETYHSFHTAERTNPAKSALTVVAFHPDSDFGPTDTDHPMINRTYFKFLHRMTSTERRDNTLEAVA